VIVNKTPNTILEADSENSMLYNSNLKRDTSGRPLEDFHQPSNRRASIFKDESIEMENSSQSL